MHFQKQIFIGTEWAVGSKLKYATNNCLMFDKVLVASLFLWTFVQEKPSR